MQAKQSPIRTNAIGDKRGKTCDSQAWGKHATAMRGKTPSNQARENTWQPSAGKHVTTRRGKTHNSQGKPPLTLSDTPCWLINSAERFVDIPTNF